MLKANSEKMLLRKMHKKFEQCKKSEKIKMLPEIHKVVSHLSDTKSGSRGLAAATAQTRPSKVYLW